MYELTPYERETIICYNAAEKTASVYTHDRSLIKKLITLSDERKDIVMERYDEDCAEFIVPKKWIKVNANRILSDEERAARSERMRSIKSGQNCN